jgi:thioredoxin
VLARGEPILVDFWAPWCEPCRRLRPRLDDVVSAHAGQVALGRLNVDEHPRSAARYDVLSLPTVLLFKDGEAVARVVGLVNTDRLRAAVAPHLPARAA